MSTITDTDTETDDAQSDDQPASDETEQEYDDERIRELIDVNIDGERIGEYDVLRHRNGDETIILLCEFGDGYQVVVVDVATNGQILDIEAVGDHEDKKRAIGMAEYWIQQHPKGLLGGEDENSGGFLSHLGWGGGE